jgi:hypothetical protein
MIFMNSFMSIKFDVTAILLMSTKQHFFLLGKIFIIRRENESYVRGVLHYKTQSTDSF